jgi:hypothetical protein
MLNRAAGILFFFIFSTSVICAQTIISKLDSFFYCMDNKSSVLHSLLALDLSENQSIADEYQINLINSISYFLIFDEYDERSYKIQIIEKGVDKLKRAIKLYKGQEETKNKLDEMYDDLFNLYYSYKAQDNPTALNIRNTLKQYFAEIKDDKIINWFKNKNWRN